MSRIIYLETTAVIDSVFKAFPDINSIVNSSKRKLTSQYVKMEILKGFLSYLVLLHNRLVQTNNWSEIQQYISNLSQASRRYHLGAILDALTAFWKKIDQKRPTVSADKPRMTFSEIFLRDIRSFLRIWIRDFFKRIDALADEVLNPMNCYVDIKPPKLIDNLFVTPSRCPNSTSECEIKKFFEDNLKDFTLIFEKLNQLPQNVIDEETKRRMAALNKIIKKLLHRNRDFSNYSQREKLCWDCGDAIQVVISPPDALVVNRNERHFKPICEAIQRECMTYSSPRSNRTPTCHPD